MMRVAGHTVTVAFILFSAAAVVILHTARAADAGHHWE